MFKKIPDTLTHVDLDAIGYELTRRMRRYKPINPLNPVPQCEPIKLPKHLLKVVDQIERELEAKYQTKIDQMSDEDEETVLNLLDKMSMDRFRTSPNYAPERGKKLVEELIAAVPYHKHIRDGKAEVIDGNLVPTDESAERLIRKAEKRGKLKAKREAILKLMQLRFDSVPEAVVKQVKSIHSLKRLDAVFENTVEAESISKIEMD